MKTIRVLPVILALLVGFSAIGQEDDPKGMKTLFNTPSSGKIANGGYGSFSIGYTELDSRSTLLLGGRAAWIANHHFALGLAGYGFINNIDDNNYNDPSKYFLAGGYGGLLLEPIIMPNKPVHISIPILIGAGGISAVESQNWSSSSSYNKDTYYYDTDAFFVLEPGVDIEFNIVKFFRVALGASYRLTNGINLRYKYLDPDDSYKEKYIDIDKNALNGFNFNVGLKFGWF